MNKFTFTIPVIVHEKRIVLAETQGEAETLLKQGTYWTHPDAIRYSELYPLDTQITQSSPEEQARWIMYTPDLQTKNK